VPTEPDTARLLGAALRGDIILLADDSGVYVLDLSVS